MFNRLSIALLALTVAIGVLSSCEKSADVAHKSAANNTVTPNPHSAGGLPQVDPLKDAEAAFQRNDYVTALKAWLPLAQSGNADAKISVGSLYQYGQGVPQDYAEALRWYHKAASQGSAPARRCIGVMYERGNGVAQDYAAALGRFRRVQSLRKDQ